ncbi:phosphotransferase [Phytohabitans kaempferiae]|uniref:Phosphotransferase n=1 Tax=Phytohabitans kaempferiae TaxID=1620943 RepID=A0ABV6M4Q0_9ACTN
MLRVLEPAVSAAGLGVPPPLEIDNTLLAAESGVGARVFEVLPDVPALVLEFLPGQTLDSAAVREPAMIPRIAAACRRLHAGPRFGNDFDIIAKLYELLDVCRHHDLPLPDGYLERLSIVEHVRAALGILPLPTVPCHNDLLAENFIDTSAEDGVLRSERRDDDGPSPCPRPASERRGSLRIVDYQLSGNNDPAFELGDIAAEADFDPDQAADLTAAYFGAETTPTLVARVRLNLLLSNVTWTLWFSVHHGLLSDRDTAHQAAQSSQGSTFDYWAEAADKWGQACRDMDAPDLGRLLQAVAGRTSLHP